MSAEFRKAFAKIASQHVEHKTASTALLHVVLPLAIAVLGVSTPFLWSVDPLVPIAFWFFVLIVYGLSWWKTSPTYGDVHSLLLQKQRDDSTIATQREKIEKLRKGIQDLYFKNIASFSYRSMSVEYVKNIRSSGLGREYFTEILDEIMSPFYLRGDVLFGFGISERWSIGVYLFDDDTNQLKAVWRKKSESHPSSGLGRTWIPGEGHVGKAFLDRRPILTGNANDEAVAQLCRARDSKLAGYDNSTYISFASVPIAMSDDDNQDPFGVLVVTSDCEDRFVEESTTELLMHAASTVALIFELTDADCGCLVNPNHDITD